MRVSTEVTSRGFGISLDTEAALKKAAEAVAAQAREQCPIDTGALKNSISVSADGNSAVISANTDYAGYVEFGTSKMAAQPFLVPALINNRAAIIDIFLKAPEVTV